MSAVPTIRLFLLTEIFAFAFILCFPLKPPQASAQTTTVPPPAARADRFGVYHWNVNNISMPADGSVNELTWGADLVGALGTRTIRIALAARDDYRLNLPDNLELAQLAQLPAYDKVLRDSRFRTILLTTYSRGAIAGNWADGYTTTEYETEREEIRRLGEYLLGNPAFAGKSFILLNWEGDNAMSLWANKRTVWDYYVGWTRARVDGVKLARQKFPSSSAQLYSGLEFNLVRSPYNNLPCGTPVGDPVRTDPLQNRCVIDYVAPQVEVDYYSYSSWQTMIDKQADPSLDLKQHFKKELGLALSLVKAKRPEITEHNFLIGEYGLERIRYGDCISANYLTEVFEAFEGAGAFQVSYAVFWQVLDNAPYFGVGSVHFGLYKAFDNQPKLAVAGEQFKKLLAGETATHYTDCPRLRNSPDSGVLNGQGLPYFQINPDSAISVFSSGGLGSFSATGNIVHFDQTAQPSELPRQQASGFSESAAQINFTLPPGRRPGPTRIYVTDAHGRDSNSVVVILNCENCPHLTTCGLLETNYQTLHMTPGDSVTLKGERFSSGGNSVVIVQRVGQHNFQKWTLTGHELALESATELRFKLPASLVPERETMLYVVNAQGLESTESNIPISSPCQNGDCPARLNSCGALTSESGGIYTSSSPASIIGRFSPAGNKVVVEQVDRQNRIYRHELAAGSRSWVESDRRILFALPSTLFAGRAMFYVIDAQGRESRAQEFTISPGALTVVSSANYRGDAVAVESIASIFGAALATTTQIATSTPLPTELAGTRVVVRDSAGVEHSSPLFFVSPNQINFQIPSGAATGAATITVFSGFGASATSAVQLVKVKPGLFATDASGKGLAAAVLLRINADGTQIYEAVADFDPIRNAFVPRPIDLGPPGEQVFLALFGTGLRHRVSLAAVNTQIGGTSAEVLYAGPQVAFAGLDQINARLPRTLAGRGEVDVAVSVDGLAANVLKVSIK